MSYTCLIVNLLSGNGKPKKILPDIESYLQKHQILYRIEYTRYKGHATDLAKECKKDPNIHLMIAIGGDGTLHEVINGLYPSDLPVGFIPAGSGNDFAKEMGLEKDPIRVLEKILRMEKKQIDIGKVNDRYFINVASIGFDGLVARIANQSKFKRLFGKLVYVYGVIRAIAFFRPQQIEMTVDGQVYSFQKIWLIAFGNHRYYGGGMAICPQAKNDDGQFDICVIKDLSHFKLLSLFPTIFFGKHVHFSEVKVIKGEKIELKLKNQMVLQMDGEIFDAKMIHVEIIKKGLTIV